MTRLLWVDVQLPPRLAEWLGSLPGVAAEHAYDLGFATTPDPAVFQAARERGASILTKDADFARLIAARGSPPQVVWIRLGNTSTRSLIEVLQPQIRHILALLDAGEPVIEVRPAGGSPAH